MQMFQVFEQWICSVNSCMASEGKSIIMLMDNAASHKIPSMDFEQIHGLETLRLSNMLIVYPPPNTTSHVQPLDAGIIAAFKQHYCTLLLRWLLNAYETADESANFS